LEAKEQTVKRKQTNWVQFGALLLAVAAVLLLSVARDLRQAGAPGGPQTSPPGGPPLTAIGPADPSTGKDLSYLADPYDLDASGGLMGNKLSADAAASGNAAQWPGATKPSAEDDLLMRPGPGRPSGRGTLNLYSPALEEQPAFLTELPDIKPNIDATAGAATKPGAK
jgi:hypothetical protein